MGQGNRPFLGLAIIFTISWSLVLLGVIVIFEFIVPFTYCSCFYDNVLKGLMGLVLGGVWLAAMIFMRNIYVGRNILRSARVKQT